MQSAIWSYPSLKFQPLIISSPGKTIKTETHNERSSLTTKNTIYISVFSFQDLLLTREEIAFLSLGLAVKQAKEEVTFKLVD